MGKFPSPATANATKMNNVTPTTMALSIVLYITNLTPVPSVNTDRGHYTNKSLKEPDSVSRNSGGTRASLASLEVFQNKRERFQISVMSFPRVDELCSEICCNHKRPFELFDSLLWYNEL